MPRQVCKRCGRPKPARDGNTEPRERNARLFALEGSQGLGNSGDGASGAPDTQGFRWPGLERGEGLTPDSPLAAQ